MERLTDNKSIFTTIGKAIRDISLFKQIVIKLTQYENLGYSPEELKQRLELAWMYEDLNK